MAVGIEARGTIFWIGMWDSSARGKRQKGEAKFSEGLLGYEEGRTYAVGSGAMVYAGEDLKSDPLTNRGGGGE